MTEIFYNEVDCGGPNHPASIAYRLGLGHNPKDPRHDRYYYPYPYLYTVWFDHLGEWYPTSFDQLRLDEWKQEWLQRFI